MPRRYTRTKPRMAPLFAVLLVVNVVAALLYSPLTALRRVRIEGAPDWDQDRLQRIADGLQGIPCAQINPHRVESEAMQEPEVRSAHLARNLFGSAALQVGYRQPVASLAGEPGVALSIEGVPFYSRHLPPDLPVVKLDEQSPVGMRLIAESWPVVTVAQLAVKAGDIFKGRSVEIELGKGNTLCLNMGAGQVVFGPCYDVESKLATLQRLLARDPALLTKVQSLNLSVPSLPSSVPKTARAKK
jgi:hypothetical protein